MKIMDSQNGSKINHLLKCWPKGTVATQEWLDGFEVYRQLAQRYCQYGWLERIARAVYIRKGDSVEWPGMVYALQEGLHLKLHIAASTALDMLGKGQYISLREGAPIWLFVDSQQSRKIPTWPKQLFSFNTVKANLLSSCEDIGLQEKDLGNFSVVIASPERAIIECLYLAPDRVALEHVATLMDKLRTLRPHLLQQLLECCSSIKVKRLFLYLAEEQNHPWFKQLDLKKIDIGKGKRQISHGGRYIAKYQISIPNFNNDEDYSGY